VIRAAITLAHGDQEQFLQTYTLIGSVTTLPYVITGTFLLAVAAGHRLGGRFPTLDSPRHRDLCGGTRRDPGR
jgi:hypothetical protein